MREVTPDVLTAIRGKFTFCHLVSIAFKSGSIYLTDAPYNIVWDGNFYLANGWLLMVEGIKNSAEMKTGDLTLGFSAANKKLLSYILNNEYRFRELTLHQAFLDENGQLIPDPIELWAGQMTSAGINDNTKNPVVSITTASVFSAFEKSNPWRTTPQSQHRRAASDGIFNRAAQALNNIIWGDKQ